MSELYRNRHYTIGDLRLSPLTPVIGAMVEGIDLRSESTPEGTAALREAVRRHKVLFFRGQDLSLPELVAFGERFGPLDAQAGAAPPLAAPAAEPHARHPALRVFDYGPSQRGREAFWHYDVLPNRRPARGAILRARVVPEVGGDTLFCDLGAVYDGLPADRKERLEDAIGVHDFAFPRQLARFRGRPEAEVMALLPEVPLDEIPLVRTRSADGTRMLFANPGFLVRIKGRREDESREIVDDLRTRVARPDVQCRFRWRPGDIAVWDNRACLHYATNNYWPERRTMERLTLIGDEDLAGPGNSFAA
jgi:taurine dioxygenase